MATLFPSRNPVHTQEFFRVALIRARELQGQFPDEMSIIQWIVAMDQHINGSTKEGETTVSINRGSPHLAQAGLHEDFIYAAELSCLIHNAQPADSRRDGFVQWPAIHYRNGGGGGGGGAGGGGAGGGGGGGGVGAGCAASASLSTYWWGMELYLNHCAVNDVAACEGVATAIAGFLSVVLPGVGAIVAGALAMSLAIQTTWLVWADSQCSGAGAYLDEPWIALGAPFIRTVC